VASLPVTTELDLPDTWAYGAGVLHGGWLLEAVTEVALRSTGNPHPLAVSAHYVAAPRLGPATVEVEPLREGRGVGTLRARLAQDGRPKVEVLFTAGTLPAAASAPFLADAAPPSLPAPEACARHEAPDGAARNGITENLDVLLDPATSAWSRGAPGGSPVVAGWIRSATGRRVDPPFLLTVADALPPVTFDLGIGGWVPTVELTVLLRCSPVDGWLRVVQRTRSVHGGWLDEECEVWDSAGQLVAQARQLAGYREPAAAASA
jgi:acyl-coenzyme A thioesterase PaaI-like protein